MKNLHNKEVLENRRAVEEFKKKLANNKELAKDLLVSIGAMTKNGRFTRSYNQVCTKSERALS